jgi:hypothetical protein
MFCITYMSVRPSVRPSVHLQYSMEAIWAPVHASSFIGIDDSNVPEKIKHLQTWWDRTTRHEYSVSTITHITLLLSYHPSKCKERFKTTHAPKLILNVCVLLTGSPDSRWPIVIHSNYFLDKQAQIDQASLLLALNACMMRANGPLTAYTQCCTRLNSA